MSLTNWKVWRLRSHVVQFCSNRAITVGHSRGDRSGNTVRQALQSFHQARQRIKCRTPELLVIVAEHSRQSARRLRVRNLTQHPRGQSPYILVPSVGWFNGGVLGPRRDLGQLEELQIGGR